MIRHFRPRKIFEVGSGNTTYLSAQAALKNVAEGGAACELVAFEPYPNEVLLAGFPGLTRLVEAKAQDIPFETFDELGDGDILFIDSSHVLRSGATCNTSIWKCCRVYPKGVIVHGARTFLRVSTREVG